MFTLFLPFWLACSETDKNSENDADNDGVLTADDCNDEDASVGVAATWYADNDGDGFSTCSGDCDIA